ncbi:MAG: hypothetical protein FIA89_03475 [Geobacter sp.]|nr:hypothetical protein [Geobacter sp.]
MTIGTLYGALCEKRLKELESKMAQKGKLAANDLYEWKRLKGLLTDSDHRPEKVGTKASTADDITFAEQYIALGEQGKTHNQAMSRLKARLRKQGLNGRNTALDKLKRGCSLLAERARMEEVQRLETLFIIEKLKSMGDDNCL